LQPEAGTDHLVGILAVSAERLTWIFIANVAIVRS
jgi:hypothetical protein